MKSGVKRSRIDPRDYIAEQIFHEERLAGSSLYGSTSSIGQPREYFCFDEDSGNELKIGGNSVYNQGATFKCVAYVCSTIREKQVYNEILNKNPYRLYTPAAANISSNSDLDWPIPGVKRVSFSKDFIYDLRQNRLGDGMSGADGMEILTKYGCIKDDDYTNYLNILSSIADYERRKRSASYQEQANLEQFIQAEQAKINQMIYRIKKQNGRDVYARVTTVNGLKESLIHNGPCLIILPFYGNPESTTFWLPSQPGSTDEMGHAVTVVGYSDSEQAFYLRNTWGPNWNGTGHVWFPYSSLPLAWEVWTVFQSGTEHLTYHKRRAGAGYPSNVTTSQPFTQPETKFIKCETGVMLDRSLANELVNKLAGHGDTHSNNNNPTINASTDERKVKFVNDNNNNNNNNNNADNLNPTRSSKKVNGLKFGDVIQAFKLIESTIPKSDRKKINKLVKSLF